MRALLTYLAYEEMMKLATNLSSLHISLTYFLIHLKIEYEWIYSTRVQDEETPKSTLWVGPR